VALPLAEAATIATITTAMTAALTGCFFAAATVLSKKLGLPGAVCVFGAVLAVHCVPSHHLNREGSFGSGYQPEGNGPGGCVMHQS